MNGPIDVFAYLGSDELSEAAKERIRAALNQATLTSSAYEQAKAYRLAQAQVISELASSEKENAKP